MDDSFAERMRARALQRMQKNAHILRNVGVEKENIEDKPVIAEHLTVKKSLSHDKMDCENSGLTKTNSRDFVLSERNCNEGRREDAFMKRCKNRLANVADKWKQFEEEDSRVPLQSTIPKQVPVKRKSPEKASVGVAPKTVKYEPAQSKQKENTTGYLSRNQATQITKQPAVPAKKEKLEQNMKTNTPEKKINHVDFKAKTPEKKPEIQYILSPKKNNAVEDKISQPNKRKALDQEVVKTLESQGYKRTESDAHLTFDFKKTRDVFDKNNERNFNKEQNATDPSLLSVAERAKLFERRLRGEETPTTFGYSNSPAKKEPEKVAPVETRIPQESPANYEITDESENSNDSINSHSSAKFDKEVEPREDVVLNISEETCSSFPDVSNEQEANLSGYPVLETIKEMKCVSTPKPGHLYPSIPDLNSDADVSSNDDVSDKISPRQNSFSIVDLNNSFGRDVLCATNDIFSSFQNSKKDITVNHSRNKSSSNLIAEVKELISSNNDTSLSLSSIANSSMNSVECPNETASFTYMKTYSNTSIDLSPVTPPNSKNYTEKSDFDEPAIEEKLDDELDVGKKIKSLEEQLIREKIALMQAEHALKLCLSTSFVNSLQHVEAEKLVLLSQLKIVTYKNEIDRIKVENSVVPSSSSSTAKGNITISNIRLPIQMAVVHTDLKDDKCNYLLCVVKCGEIVLSSEVMPVEQKNIKQDSDGTYVEFSDSLTVSNVNSDFRITLEVYNLLVDRKDVLHSKHSSAKKDKKGQHNAKKLKESKASRPIEKKRNLQSSFFTIGYMIFSLNEVGRHQWILNKQGRPHCPLVGMIMMNIKCNLALTSVEKHGFLTMYEVVSGYGAWSRYWFHLSGEKLSFWKYPEEESVKDPIGNFDLKKCITKVVETPGIEITMRPHTFMLQFDPPSYLLSFKGLTEERLLLSADNGEELKSWSSSLNEIFNSVRLWSN